MSNTVRQFLYVGFRGCQEMKSNTLAHESKEFFFFWEKNSANWFFLLSCINLINHHHFFLYFLLSFVLHFMSVITVCEKMLYQSCKHNWTDSFLYMHAYPTEHAQSCVLWRTVWHGNKGSPPLIPFIASRLLSISASKNCCGERCHVNKAVGFWSLITGAKPQGNFECTICILPA